MKRIVLSERSRTNLLHVETPLGIINIRIGLTDNRGARVNSVEIIPNDYAGERKVSVDGYRNTRLIEQTDSEFEHSKVKR